jgi:hypothetical protein
MSRIKYRRLAAQLAISIAAAAITPAAGAGLVEGVKVAAATVDDATNMPTIAATSPSAIAADETGAPASLPDPSSGRIATGAPRRLSALAGNDAVAWASARSAHIEHPHKPGT